MSHLPEHLAQFDPRYLDHRSDDLARFAAFGREHADRLPVAVEIGCNRGAFLEGVARTHGPSPVLGLEWREKYCRLAIERLHAREIGNAIVLHGDARLVLPTVFPPESLDAVYVTFPDPWWKKRHADRRVLDPVFMRIIARRLRPRGRLYLKSDVFEYLHRVRQFAQVSRAFRPLPPERWPDETTWTLTTRERKCMRAAIPFGRGYYERLDDFDTSLPVAPERAEDFAVDESLSPEDVIRGPAPIDRPGRNGRGRRSR